MSIIAYQPGDALGTQEMEAGGEYPPEYDEPFDEYPPDPYEWMEASVSDKRLLHLLEPEHYCKLVGSALSDETILTMGAYSESNRLKLRLMFNGWPYSLPALVLPYFDRHGKRIDYQVARLFPPHRFPSGKEAKFIMPQGRDNRAYFPPHPIVWEALNTPGATIGITEGIAKALAAVQAGVPCIGLMGPWNWTLKRKDKNAERQLIPDLDGINWWGRKVLIVADADPKRKPSVNQAVAEFAQVLTERGAECILPRLPLGPQVRDGLPEKQAIDDFAYRFGDDRLRQWVQDQLAQPPVPTLEGWRREIARPRAESVVLSPALPDLKRTQQGPVLLDRGPTGVGKSYADLDCIAKVTKEVEEQAMNTITDIGLARELVRSQLPRSLTLVNAHVQCDDVVKVGQKVGLPIVPYPRLDSDSCAQFDEAQAVQNRGLSFMKVLCPECPFRDGCPYVEQLGAARAADHTVATYARAAIPSTKIFSGRTVLSLHETALDCLRPTWVTDNGLETVELVTRVALRDAVEDQDNNIDCGGDSGFYEYMGKVARELADWLRKAKGPTEIPLPTPYPYTPKNLHKDLNKACAELGVSPPQDAMRIVLAAVLGQLSLLAVAVDERPDGRDENNEVKIKTVRKLVAVSKLDLPTEVALWINDATAVESDMAQVLGRPIKDITPKGRLPLRVPAIQIIPTKDVTKARTAESVLPLLRGLLHNLSQYKRVGLITHMKLSKKLPELLEEPYRSRLAKVSYFGGGLSRGSNVWMGVCDCLIILGTPRVDIAAIRAHLMRLGKTKAALMRRHEVGWGPDYWSGVYESGRRVTVKTSHYTNHDWHSAYCYMVCGELVQAVGRGRGILENGIPVFVVTTENLAPHEQDDGQSSPVRIADHPYAPLTEAQAKVLGCLRRDGQRVRRKTGEIAKVLEINPKTAYEHLTELAQAGRIVRIGKGSGWRLS